jgi:hypothetical protein
MRAGLREIARRAVTRSSIARFLRKCQAAFAPLWPGGARNSKRRRVFRVGQLIPSGRKCDRFFEHGAFRANGPIPFFRDAIDFDVRSALCAKNPTPPFRDAL